MSKPTKIDIEEAIAAQVEVFLDGKVELRKGDCRDVLRAMPDNSIDSVVTDPPYALVSIVKRFGGENAAPAKSNGPTGAYARASKGFMGQKWDTGETAFAVEFWAEVLRVLKPGGHVVAFSGTRTYHRMACAIEDSGFEIRDQLQWLYGSGFPKSHDVSKGIDKAAGAEREVVGASLRCIGPSQKAGYKGTGTFKEAADNPGNLITAPSTDAAKQWEGWGSALKPSFEPLCLAQKPLNYGQNIATIGSHLAMVWSRLWLMLSAKDAARHSTLSPSVCGADVSAFAQWNAGDASSTRAALSAQMGTSPFASALISSLNTVSSWNAIWTDASKPENTFITETELGTTIGWRTLRFLLSKITVESIIQAHRSGRWSIADASPAERAFNASVLGLSSTLELSALALAMTQEADASLVAGVEPNASPICLARKPLIGTIAQNVLTHGTGALNIDGCRVETNGEDRAARYAGQSPGGSFGSNGIYGEMDKQTSWDAPVGRWPANLIHDGSEEVLAGFPHTQSGEPGIKHGGNNGSAYHEESRPPGTQMGGFGDSGSAARFFYTAKADSSDRLGSKHPTVKPLDLMQWLCRMITPRGGVVLDTFAGTGSTGEAAWREGMRAILVEREPEYQADIARRMELAANPTKRAAVAKTKNNLDDPNALPLFAKMGE